MMEYLEFMFISLGHFIGSCIIIGIAVNFVWAIYKRTLTFLEVLVRGHKPPKVQKEEVTETP